MKFFRRTVGTAADANSSVGFGLKAAGRGAESEGITSASQAAKDSSFSQPWTMRFHPIRHTQCAYRWLMSLPNLGFRQQLPSGRLADHATLSNCSIAAWMPSGCHRRQRGTCQNAPTSNLAGATLYLLTARIPPLINLRRNYCLLFTSISKLPRAISILEPARSRNRRHLPQLLWRMVPVRGYNGKEDIISNSFRAQRYGMKKML